MKEIITEVICSGIRNGAVTIIGEVATDEIAERMTQIAKTGRTLYSPHSEHLINADSSKGYVDEMIIVGEVKNADALNMPFSGPTTHAVLAQDVAVKRMKDMIREGIQCTDINFFRYREAD